MCNCGNKTQYAPRVATASPSGSFIKPSRQKKTVDFEYIGSTAMTVRGPFSGARYRFDHPGAHLRVDERDASSLAAIPGLRLIN